MERMTPTSSISGSGVGPAFRLNDMLAPENVLASSRARDKQSILALVAAHASPALGLPAAPILTELERREALGSTGIGAGIGIPHARIAGIDKPFGILVRLLRAVEFEAIDGLPVDLVFALLLPGNPRPDLEALASVTRKLRQPEVQRRLRAAPDAVTMVSVMAEDCGSGL
jgi:nitrogen PTS system EIIA component